MVKKEIFSARYFLMILATAIGVVACGGGKNEILDRPPRAIDIANQDPLPTNSPETSGGGISSALLLRDKIEALENSGKIPKLDRTETFAGVDNNQDGVRDDIAAFISEWPLSVEQKRAFMQEARALQATLFVDLTDKVALQYSGDRTMAAINCSGDQMPGDFYIVGEKIQAMTFNTNLRLRRFMQYNAARSGSVTSMPNHDTCE